MDRDGGANTKLAERAGGSRDFGIRDGQKPEIGGSHVRKIGRTPMACFPDGARGGISGPARHVAKRGSQKPRECASDTACAYDVHPRQVGLSFRRVLK